MRFELFQVLLGILSSGDQEEVAFFKIVEELYQLLWGFEVHLEFIVKLIDGITTESPISIHLTHLYESLELPLQVLTHFLR